MQSGFFDDEDRLAKLEKLGDPLPRLDSIVDWQAFAARQGERSEGGSSTNGHITS